MCPFGFVASKGELEKCAPVKLHPPKSGTPALQIPQLTGPRNAGSSRGIWGGGGLDRRGEEVRDLDDSARIVDHLADVVLLHPRHHLPRVVDPPAPRHTGLQNSPPSSFVRGSDRGSHIPTPAENNPPAPPAARSRKPASGRAPTCCTRLLREPLRPRRPSSPHAEPFLSVSDLRDPLFVASGYGPFKPLIGRAPAGRGTGAVTMSEPPRAATADSNARAATAKSGVPIGGAAEHHETGLPSKYQQAKERARRQRKKEKEKVRNLARRRVCGGQHMHCGGRSSRLAPVPFVPPKLLRRRKP